MNALECKCFLCKHHLNVDIYRVVICFLCIFLPNFVPLLTPIALICWVMSNSVDRSSVTCGNVISDADLRNRQWWFRAASYSILPAGTVEWRRWKTMMSWCLLKPVSELRQARLIVVDIGDAVCLFRQSWGVSGMAVAVFWPTFYRDIARAERKISCAGAVRNRAAHSQVRPESGFTKFRFQAMTQYPEKSDQCMACQIRYGVRAIWLPIGWMFQDIFFRRHIIEPETGETGLSCPQAEVSAATRPYDTLVASSKSARSSGLKKALFRSTHRRPTKGPPHLGWREFQSAFMRA